MKKQKQKQRTKWQIVYLNRFILNSNLIPKKWLEQIQEVRQAFIL